MPGQVHITDEQLMLQLASGNRSAFEILYERYFGKLVWFAHGFLNDMPRAEDAVQEVFVKIIESPDSFDENRKFSTWVYTVTGNVCKQMLRNDKNRLRILKEQVAPQSAASTSLNDKADYRLLQVKLDNTLNEMSEKEKMIYSLRFEQELGIKEIAAILEIPEGSVKSGIYYLLKKMSVQLKDFTHEK